MINTYVKKIYGLVGAVRTGKDSVANFLTETRGFKQFAFADQIKEEFGISKEDFEAAKIAGNIEELRDQLWEFSAKKKKEDPLYFVKKVINKVENYNENAIITDIRTQEELSSFFNINTVDPIFKRIYWIRGDLEKEIDSNGKISGSKLIRDDIANLLWNSHYDLRCIYNNTSGLYTFYQQLDKFFFAEDIEDIWSSQILRGNSRPYLNQFEIKMKENII